MKIETFLFGGVEVDPDRVISFPDGLLAFESNKRFMLIHEAEKGAPVSYTLQSLDDSTVAFQIIDPAALGFAYELELSDQDNAKLGAPNPDDLVVMQLLFKREEGGSPNFGANIRAPLIINTKARIGIQKVIERPRPNITISNLSSAV
ncbi:MAG: flagellar biosynthesis protein FliW [Proteobacteria bacterium]|nr:flagellar biosynthesis protein FliW [Pseudomonadota bacterium]